MDYYDLSRTAGSPDPAHSAVTQRVMTIMRSDEYWVLAVPSKKRAPLTSGADGFVTRCSISSLLYH
nr:DUF3768 domain-containing protein [Bradyrhizobium murdochi]